MYIVVSYVIFLMYVLHTHTHICILFIDLLVAHQLPLTFLSEGVLI